MWMMALLLAGCASDPSWEMRHFRLKGQHHQAIAFFESQYKLSDELSYEPLQDLCKAYFETRRYTQFMRCADHYLKSVAADKTTQYFTEEKIPVTYGEKVAPVLAWRALMRIDLGEYEAALKDALEANAQLQKVRDKWVGIEKEVDEWAFLTLDVYRAAGLAYALLDKREQAYQFIQRTNEVFGPSNMQELSRLRALAQVQILIALKDYRAALELVREQTTLNPFAVVMVAVSFINPVQGAMEALSTIERTERIKSVPASYLPQLFMFAKTLFETQQDSEAAASYDLFLANPYRVNYPSLEVAALYDRGRLAQRAGDVAGAIDFFTRAMAAGESRRSLIQSETAQTGFATSDPSAVYKDLVALLLEQHRDAEALLAAERGRHRRLVSLLAKEQSFAGVDEAGAALVEALDEAEARLLERDFLADGAAVQTKAAEPAQIRARIAKQYPRMAPLVGAGKPSLAPLLAQLSPRERLLVYFRDGDKLWGFVAYADGRVKGVALRGDNLQKLAALFRSILENPDKSGYQDAAEALYQRLIGPLADELKGADKLLTIPSGAIHGVPLGALIDPQSSAEPLMSRFAMRRLPGFYAAVWLNQQQTGPEPEGQLLAVGHAGPDVDPGQEGAAQRQALALARQEAVALAMAGRPVRDQARVLTGAKATEAGLVRAGESYRYLHVALDGRFDAEQWRKTGLNLLPGGGEDGRLLLPELFQHPWRWRVATFSGVYFPWRDGADTGLEAAAFQAGWLYGGARGVLTSLWRTEPDATQQFILAYYANLARMTPQEALRATQQEMRAAGYEHPYYWAPYVYAGESAQNP
ncbi:hypothetical protein MAIT1_01553 [Magnetofaba australis IT-1]|uniref:CHAT domain-containing protein n=1 Tax=Magnetofaba australis IT-1 TaxID=1434232 RepID=A0A1Y2K1K3_9PROT|nr:hypothetical protein MAIT1_01553 [Magnetofaba australis IT-1]